MDTSFKGTCMKDIYKGQGPWSYEIPPIYPSKYHTILFEMPPSLNSPPKPHVSAQTYHWDEGYLRMPYSSKNLFPCKDKNGKDTLVSRWEVIKDALSRPILSSRDLETAIGSYNSKLPSFTALNYLFEEALNEDEAEHFFKSVLPKIIKLALQLPDILPGSIPLLKMDACKSVSLSQWQIASILANCFLCTFPWRKDVCWSYPGANFTSLFSGNITADQDGYMIEKLKCVLHYFRRVLDKAPTGVITFERQHIRRSNMPRWDKVKHNLGNTRMHICSTGTIEDNGLGLLQVDFANRFLGGGVLGFGCVQEEIRFLICPELLVSRLFTEKLGNSESVIITGVERFSKYNGYGDTFSWAGDYRDDTPFDSSGRRRTTIVAIDATYYAKTADQFHTSQILRELNKAYAGYHSRFNVSLLPAVATGNWGCGAFRGNVHLKYLIQLMACSAANRDMVYYTFGDEELRDSIYNMYTFIATNKVTVCQLWRIMCRFVTSDLSPDKFFPFVQQAFFDLKNQPTIKTFFGINKKSEESEEIKPSTSNTAGVKDDPFVVIDMGMDDSDVVCVPEPPTQNSVKRKRSQSSDLLNLIGQIDGVKELNDSKSSGNGGYSLLSSIDEFTKKQNEQKAKERTEDMEVDDPNDNSEKGTVKSKGVDKKKITDYFKKM